MFGIFIIALASMNEAAPQVPSCLYSEPVRERDCLPEQLFVYVDHTNMLVASGEVSVTAEALTRHGYAPADGIPIIITFKQNNTITERIARTRSGLAITRFPIGKRAGMAYIEASYKGIKSNIRYLDIQPGKPRRFAFRLKNAPGTSNYTLTASNLTDKYGNTIRDGKAATITVLVDGQLVSQQLTQIFNGTLRTEVTAPDARATIAVTIDKMRASVPVSRYRRNKR